MPCNTQRKRKWEKEQNDQRQHWRSPTKNPKISKRRSCRSSSNFKREVKQNELKAFHRHREFIYFFGTRPTHSHARISLERVHLCGECVWKCERIENVCTEKRIQTTLVTTTPSFGKTLHRPITVSRPETEQTVMRRTQKNLYFDSLTGPGKLLPAHRRELKIFFYDFRNR